MVSKRGVPYPGVEGAATHRGLTSARSPVCPGPQAQALLGKSVSVLTCGVGADVWVSTDMRVSIEGGGKYSGHRADHDLQSTEWIAISAGISTIMLEVCSRRSKCD